MKVWKYRAAFLHVAGDLFMIAVASVFAGLALFAVMVLAGGPIE